MSKKKDPILVALGNCPEKWNSFLLKTYGLPQTKSTREEVQQDSIRVFDPQSKRPKPVSLDEAGLSATQLTDQLTSLHIEASANDGVILSPEWLLYVEYMDVIAEALSPKDNGTALKHLALADARSRHWEQPPRVFHPMNASLGTPSEFRQQWIYGELEIRTRAGNRREHLIEIWQLPPLEPEDLDEAGEPSGHWEGLTWVPDPPKISGS
jgi:hypothetical protein